MSIIEGIGIALAALVVALLLTIPFVYLAQYAEERSCQEKAEVMSVDYRWTSFAGCLVNFEGRWVPLDRIVIRSIN